MNNTTNNESPKVVPAKTERKAFVEPKATFVEPRIVEAGEITAKTGGFGTFTP